MYREAGAPRRATSFSTDASSDTEFRVWSLAEFHEALLEADTFGEPAGASGQAAIESGPELAEAAGCQPTFWHLTGLLQALSSETL
jgi:hypothetical protein